MTQSSRIRWWLWAGIALTLVKLWLTRGQAIFAIGTAEHDDQLFLRLADSILKGDWLGPYDQLTLAKGPFYSLFVAASFLLNLPLGLAQQAAYAGSCALVVRALAPRLTAGWARFAAYAALLWNPMSFEATVLGRVLRQHVSTPLALLIFAGLIALYLRRDRPFRSLAGWAALLGAALGAFWLTREDCVWMAPSVALLAGAIVVAVVRERPLRWLPLTQAAALAAACAATPVILVCSENASHYQWWGAVEFRASEFKDAYGALLRVKVGPTIPFVPVTRQAREAIYRVSPTFAMLKSQLDGPIGEGWAGASNFVTHLPAGERQIGGGWFMWALRDSVAAAGFCHNADQALGFYHRVAMEVNAACDSGRLPAGPRRSGFLPPWQPGETRAWLAAAWDFVPFFTQFRSFSAYPPGSIGNRDDLELFRDLTRDNLGPAPALDPPPARQLAVVAWQLAVLQGIGKLMRHSLFGLVLAANVVAVIRLLQLAWRRRLTYLLVVAAAAWGACAVTILMDALIQVTSFPTLSVGYLDSAYPLMILFAVATFADAGSAVGEYIRSRGRPEAAAPAEAA